MTRYLSKEEWITAEERYVYGDPITYRELAALLGVGEPTVANHAAPKNKETGYWKYKRGQAQKELRLDAKARMLSDQERLSMDRTKAFEQRYESSSTKLNDLLDMLLDYFVPQPGASEEAFRACKEQLDALSSNQKAMLVVRCTERLSGIAKTRQLLTGGATERLLIDLKNNDDIGLSARTEALIEEVLVEARRMRSSDDL